jgi:ketosteroid isomerase-like protein
MNIAVMDREVAGRFVEDWRANWCRVDIDAVVSHLTEDAEMRSPLALKLTDSPIVKGAENIRRYWQRAYGHVQSADLKVLAWSWDVGEARASEFMDFDSSGRVKRSEAFYGK